MANQKFQVEIVDKDMTFMCLADESVLSGAERAFPRNPLIGCRMGGCGFCRVRVLSGTFESGRMSRAHASAEEQQEGIVLACRIYPRSDLRIEFLGLKQS